MSVENFREGGYSFKPYKNVYKEAYLFGLPSTLFAIFVGVAFTIGLLMLVIQSFFVSILGAMVLGGVYGLLHYLVLKFGPFFFKKLMSYYTDQSFSILRKVRSTKNILKGESKI